MKRIIFIIITLLCGTAAAIAQNTLTLTGTILDQGTNEPLPFATVAILKADSTLLSGGVTDDKGIYTIHSVPQGHYTLSVTFIGYQTYQQPIVVRRGGEQLSAIYLTPDATMLQTVQVTAKAPLVEQQIDKLVMNIAQSAFAQGNTAFDLIRKAPGVTIDKDGNVLLNGSAVAVWIDGRPSQLDGKSLEALLRGTEGTSIDKIEIIANPSAKYDAEGQGGIINIKTKRNLMQGLNGTLTANVGGMGYKREMEQIGTTTSHNLVQDMNFNLNYRTAQTNTFLQLSESTEPLSVDLSSETATHLDGVDFLQRTFTLYDAKGTNRMLKVGNDWFINPKNTIGVNFSIPYNSMVQGADSNHNRSYQMVNDHYTQVAKTNATTTFDMTQYMINTNYTHIFDEATAHELTANIDYLYNHSLQGNEMDNYLLPAELNWRLMAIDSTRLRLQSDNRIEVYSNKVDYQRVVLGRFLMEAGGKWALSNTYNIMSLSLNAPMEETQFEYTETIGALYATLAGQITPHWSVKVGLRGEHTYAFNNTGSVTQDYSNLFPTAFVGYNSSDMMKRVNLSYTRRIQRPNFLQLNPFSNYVDAHTANQGNPDIKPAFNDVVYLSAGFGQYVTISANFNKIHNQMGLTPNFDPTTGNQTMKFDNIGTSTFIGGGITLAELPLGKALSLMVNASLYDFHNYNEVSTSLVQGTASDGKPREVRSLYGSGYACLTWNLPKQWKAQLDGWFSSPVTSGYMHVDWNYSCNLAVKKTAMEGRLVCSLNVNDLFRTLQGSFSVVGQEGMTSHYDQRYLTQHIQVGLQWNFGTAQKPMRQRKVSDIDEASRMGNSSSLGGNQ